MTELQRIDEGGWHHYHLLLDGRVVASAKWRRNSIDPVAAEFHNHVYKKSHTVFKATRQVFADIKQDMRQAGCTRVVVTDELRNVDHTRLRYWELMGFTFTGTHENYRYAVQEV